MVETATPAPAEEEPEATRIEGEQRYRRQSPAEQALAVIRSRLEERLVEIDSGPLEGLKVISEDNVREALEEPLPMLAIHGAQVQTPAKVTVSALCPRCYLPGTVTLDVGSELRVSSDEGATLRPKVKATKVSHLCGQLPLPDPTVDGQQDFDLEDIVGDQGDDAEDAPDGEAD